VIALAVSRLILSGWPQCAPMKLSGGDERTVIGDYFHESRAGKFEIRLPVGWAAHRRTGG
jgi:hypothetical protein